MKTPTLIALVVCSLWLSACAVLPDAGDPEAESTLDARIVQISERSLLVAATDADASAGDLYSVVSDTSIIDASNTTIAQSSLKVGQIIRIGFDGIVQESFPMGISSPQYIKILQDGDNLLAMYQEIFHEIYATDDALNDSIDILAFDLTEVTNLNEAEKSAIAYLISNQYHLTPVLGTLDQLSDMGYINKEDLYFENGILLTIALTSTSNDRFSFIVTKWRSGLGAIGFDTSTATKRNGIWTFELKGAWIS